MAAPRAFSIFRRIPCNFGALKRGYCSEVTKKGVILGVYSKEDDKEEGFIFTKAAEEVNSRVSGRLQELLNVAGPTIKPGQAKILYDVNQDFSCVAVVGLGKQSAGYSHVEQVNEAKENIRAAVAAGATQLRESGAKCISVDPCTDAQAAAEGASLALFSYDELKDKSKKKPKVELDILGDPELSAKDQWARGLTLAGSQNFARTLMEMPANRLTPRRFAEITGEQLRITKTIVTRAHTQQWALEQGMGAFLSVAKGSDQPPIFLEMTYNGADPEVKPLLLIGKGVTFDSGGISIKPAQNMEAMRADMGGAAVVAGALDAIAKLRLAINVVAITPLCENLLNGSANKPGDVVKAMNGKTIQIDNTDAEGRLLLADALCYACREFEPRAVIDLATLTGAVDVALGSAATGTFSTSETLWSDLHQAGVETGDRLWRMPLFQHYSSQMTESHLADVNNIGKHARSGGSCTAAAFLKEFVTVPEWAHLDIAGVMENKDEIPYLGKGMTGRPMRTLVEFVAKMAGQS
ncbi:cytosol aminopeptidase-like [Acanthaster planci]|uniref:Cytosol aminopeptidase n=1 Tax=Acanthaster planci TaxID=133434 RepID=A0A8B7ZMP9_ACAPL|nr:cytosol aminopeptidase-like [Acanthaster planci]